MKTNMPYKEIKFMGPHEYNMRAAWEKKQMENIKKIQKIAGIGLIASFLIGWLVVLVPFLVDLLFP